MARLCLLRGWTGQDSELNWVTLPALAPKQTVSLEKLVAEIRLPLGKKCGICGVLSSSKCFPAGKSCQFQRGSGSVSSLGWQEKAGGP